MDPEKELEASTPPPPPTTTKSQFPCKDCGANLVFAPGTTSLKCPYCGVENQIAAENRPVEEENYDATINALAGSADTVEAMLVKCDLCGADSHFPPNVVANKCPFCGHAIVATTHARRLIKPKAVLPFTSPTSKQGNPFGNGSPRDGSQPSALKRDAERAAIAGAYIPAWTYDADAYSQYTGQRGDDYWDTETYTQTVNGQSVTRTRQVRKTRWRSVSGDVSNQFDDVLVLASQSLPRKLADSLEPWDLANLLPYRDEYLSGFVAESYQIDLPQGFTTARQIMDGVIRQTIMRDIGGDHQRIGSVNTQHSNITFKHILLPLWISAYEFRGRNFRFLVNARTGEVQGERPYSWIKITLLVLAILAAILTMVAIFNS